MPRFGGFVVLVASVMGMPSLASAQNTNDINAGIQFDFSLPGGRSLAMAGAFVALADDATAAYSNPAGLSVLSRPEMSAEGRHWGFATPVSSVGHAFGPPSNRGLDTIAGLVDTTVSSRATSPSFVSAVYPTRRWAVAVFRHQLTRFNTSKQIQGPYFDCAGGFRGDDPPRAPFCEDGARDGGVDREFPKQQRIDLDISSVGAAGAFKFSEGFSVGVSALRYSFRIDSSNRVFNARGAWWVEPNFSYPENLELESTQQGHDHAFGTVVGLLWKPRFDLSVGASFRQGPKFAFELKTVYGPGHPCVRESCGVRAGDIIALEETNPFKVPDSYVVGLAFNPTQNTTISFEYDRVQFSQLIDDLRDPARPSEQESAVVRERMKIDDANQFRVGFEYLKLYPEKILALQAGVWYDPDHAMQFRADDPATGYPAPRWAVLFPPGKTALHLTAGIGLVFSEHLQIDSGFDYSRAAKTLSVSAVWMY